STGRPGTRMTAPRLNNINSANVRFSIRISEYWVACPKARRSRLLQRYQRRLGLAKPQPCKLLSADQQLVHISTKVTQLHQTPLQSLTLSLARGCLFARRGEFQFESGVRRDWLVRTPELARFFGGRCAEVGVASMNPRICICCGEPMAENNHGLSRNPNVCASCSSMADGMGETRRITHPPETGPNLSAASKTAPPNPADPHQQVVVEWS